MNKSVWTRRWIATATTVALSAAGILLTLLPTPASAVLGGENGRIVFLSGRPPETDATARLYLLPVPSNSVGGGMVSAPIVPAGGQYRHPSWSPDRTKIVFANGSPANGYDLFVIDLEAGTGPVQITPTEGAGAANLVSDRPAWSPDGNQIVYEQQPSAGSADRFLQVQSALDLQPPIATSPMTAPGAPFEGKPAWTPDSQTVYFHRGDPSMAINADIYRKPAAGGTEVLAIPDSGISEFQPSISPDGSKICFTLANGGFNSTTDVLVAPLSNPGGAVVVSKSITLGDYNCTWSPDGQMVAYVNGIFGTGRLVMVKADNSSPIEIELADAAGFDGNPDWAPDGRPECPDDLAFETEVDQPLTFQAECLDTGPEYEKTEPREFAETQPTSGTLTQELAGDPFTYTPNPGFTGTDSFEFSSFDEAGFGTDNGTVTITVKAPVVGPTASCAGKTATIEGTPGPDVLTGTPGRDVIASMGGGDRVKALGGNDLVCGGGGKDLINGARGKDTVFGGNGPDVIRGGPQADRLVGGPGRDRLIGGAGRDRLQAGPARDVCKGGPGRDRARGCERRSSIP